MICDQAHIWVTQSLQCVNMKVDCPIELRLDRHSNILISEMSITNEKKHQGDIRLRATVRNDHKNDGMENPEHVMGIIYKHSWSWSSPGIINYILRLCEDLNFSCMLNKIFRMACLRIISHANKQCTYLPVHVNLFLGISLIHDRISNGGLLFIYKQTFLVWHLLRTRGLLV